METVVDPMIKKGDIVIAGKVLARVTKIFNHNLTGTPKLMYIVRDCRIPTRQGSFPDEHVRPATDAEILKWRLTQ
jgi:hypothetical protein